MKKISITFNIPAIGNEFDFMIPDVMIVSDAKKLIVKILKEEYGVFCNISNVNMFDTNDGKMLHNDINFKQQGIKDGCKIMMI